MCKIIVDSLLSSILWYLKNYEKHMDYLKNVPSLNYSTISTVTQADMNTLLGENKGKADFIICVDLNMTTTY